MAIKPIFESVDELKQTIENLSIEALARELAGPKPPLLLDIREIQEQIDLGTIPGAIHAPRGMLEFWADPASPYFRNYFTEEQRTVVFCAGGGRSAFAAKALLDMGYQDVAHLEEGFSGWAKAGQTVEETASRSRWMRKPEDVRPAIWVGHLSINVPDPAKSKAFFVATGMRDLSPGSDIAILELRGGTHLILAKGEPADDLQAPFDLMVDDVDASHAAFAELGLEPGPISESRFHRSFILKEPGDHSVVVHSSHVEGVV